MIYTFRITDNNSTQAESIINLLNAFAKDYDFLENITEEEQTLSPEQESELDKRYEYYLENPTVGKSWEEVEANL